MKLILAIATGGAIVAVARHIIAHQVALLFGHGFPWGTLVVNVLGSLLLGGLIETLAIAWSPSAAVRGFLAVGILGAFTTFSAFSMDVLLLYERGQWVAAALYITASVMLSLAALVVGLRLARLVLV
jgi:CrcB protein